MNLECGCSAPSHPSDVDVLMVMRDDGGGEAPTVVQVQARCALHGLVEVWDEDGERRFNFDEFIGHGYRAHF